MEASPLLQLALHAAGPGKEWQQDNTHEYVNREPSDCSVLLSIKSPRPCAKMPSGFFKNRRVYLLTTVAYTGSLLFGESKEPRDERHLI